jgi:hypothetical protein
MTSATPRRIPLTLFAILQIAGIALIAFGLVSAARDAWSACAGAFSLLAGFVLLLLSILPIVLALKGVKAALMALAVLLEIAASIVALSLFFRMVVIPKREQIELSNPAATVQDARRLLAETTEHRTLFPSSLPPSLRIPHLRYANLHGDHIDLVTYRNPDDSSGFRIWSATATRKHADRPTRYPGIFIFEYNNDFGDAPDNLP